MPVSLLVPAPTPRTRREGLPLATLRRARSASLLAYLAFLGLLAWPPGFIAQASAASGWQAPLRPLTLTRAFQRPATVYAAGHRGVDLGGKPGEPVRSAAAGDVSFAGTIAGRGVIVVVHGSLHTTYEPVLARIGRGEQVTAGQQIGVLEAGHPGCPVAACLHWGLLRGDLYLDPMSVLTATAVRLYPPIGFAGAHVAGEATIPPESMGVPLREPDGVSATSGPSPTTWSLVALSGAGVVVAFRRR